MQASQSETQAVRSRFKKEWSKAIEEETNQLLKLKVFKVVLIPEERHLMDSKFVFSVKTNSINEVTKFKARLVARGFTQIEGIDYTDTYSSVAPLFAINAVLSIAISKNYVFKQLDVKTAYLHARLDEELYMKVPVHLTSKVDPRKYCWKLEKALYGTKQGAKCWQEEITKTLTQIGMVQSNYDVGS